MPTYDYVCDGCGYEFEAFEPITSQPQKDCPECKVPKLRRKIGPGAAILFKGSGFYATDSRAKPAEKKPAASPDAATASTDSSTDSKAEPKSAGTSETKFVCRYAEPGAIGGMAGVDLSPS